MAKQQDGYLSAKESRRISKENRRITDQYEKQRKRKNVPESEYLTQMKNPENAVEFDNLHTYFFTDTGVVKSVDGVSFEVPVGKTVGVVGESGCGKSVTSLSLMQLLQRPQGQIVQGEIRLNLGNGKAYDVAKTPGTVMQHLRGNYISMIFQEPMTSLNPVLKVGRQVRETLLVHNPTMSKAEAKQRVVEMFQRVGIPEAEKRYDCYPHELSGGLRQRVMIAMAMVCKPKLLIADEPTTALDVTIQAQILQLLKEMQVKYNLTIVLITHDLGVVANIADRVAVMYAGDIVEIGTSDEIYYDPRHPYTWALLSSMPQMGIKGEDLFNIQGTPPNLFTEIHGDAFAPRNPQALKIDFVKRPPYFTVSPTHKAKTWLLDPRAPKVEPPAAVKLLKEEGMQDA